MILFGRADASCAPVVENVTLCSAPGGHGAFRIANASAHAVFRGRVVGDAVQQLRPLGNTHHLSFHLPSGAYRAYIERLYDAFDERDIAGSPPPLLQEAIVDGYAFTVVRYERENATLPCGSAGVCGSTARWTHVSATGAWALNGDPERARAASDAVFHPHGCFFAPVDAPIRACIVGDSQARHLSGALDELMRGSTKEATSSHTNRDVTRTDAVTYVDDRYGECMRTPAACAYNLSTCPIILVNFGQWPSGNCADACDRTRPSPWSIPQYEREVFDALIAGRRAYGDRLAWLTVHPHGDRADVLGSTMYSTPPIDWRTSHVLHLYAGASMRAARAAGVPALNVHCLGDPLHDLTYDGAHYMHPVETEIARSVYHFVRASYKG